MGGAASSTFALDGFVIDGVRVAPSALSLTGPMGQSTLEPKVMALLVALSKRPRELWQRADLLEEIWPNGFGSDEGLSRLVSLLRKTLANDHGLRDTVITVHKLGYRLDAEVEFQAASSSAKHGASGMIANATDPNANDESGSNWRPGHILMMAGVVVAVMGLVWFALQREPSANPAAQITLDQSRISMAVLPIESMVAIKDRAFLAEGMTRDLTAALSQVPNATVAPYSSTRLLPPGAEIDPADAAEKLDVRYLITGSMTAEGEQMVLRMDLTDTAVRRQIWSKRFSQPTSNFFGLQDEVVRAIATSIFSEIQASEIASVRGKDQFDLSVYELLQKAESERYAYGREPAARIIANLEHALEIDPDNYSARAALAIQLAQNVISGFSDEPLRDAPLALRYLDEVRAIAPRDPQVLTSTAMVQYYINGDMPQAEGLLEQSLAIDPNEPHAAVVLGLIRCYTGQTEEGLTLIRNSEARAPRDPRYGIWAWFRGACQSVTGDIAGAELAVAEAIARNPNYPPFHYASASYKCLLGRDGEASAAVRQARRLDSEFDQKDYERLLTTAGFPGIPGKPRDEVFEQMRTCLAGGNI